MIFKGLSVAKNCLRPESALLCKSPIVLEGVFIFSIASVVILSSLYPFLLVILARYLISDLKETNISALNFTLNCFSRFKMVRGFSKRSSNDLP